MGAAPACVDDGRRDEGGRAAPASKGHQGCGLPNAGRAWTPKPWRLAVDDRCGLADVGPCSFDPKGGKDGARNVLDVADTVDAVEHPRTLVVLSHWAGLSMVGLQACSNR